MKCNDVSDTCTKKHSTKKKEGHPPEGSPWKPPLAHLVACVRMRMVGYPSTEKSGFRTSGSGEPLTQLLQMEMVVGSSGDTLSDGLPPLSEAALSIGQRFHWPTQLPGTNLNLPFCNLHCHSLTWKGREASSMFLGSLPYQVTREQSWRWPISFLGQPQSEQGKSINLFSMIMDSE